MKPTVFVPFLEMNEFLKEELMPLAHQDQDSNLSSQTSVHLWPSDVMHSRTAGDE